MIFGFGLEKEKNKNVLFYNEYKHVADRTEEEGVNYNSWNSKAYDILLTSELEYDSTTPFVGFTPIRKIKD